MMQHPDTSYRLAEQRLNEYREQGAAERFARSLRTRRIDLAAVLSDRMASFFKRIRAWRVKGLRKPALPTPAPARDTVDLRR